MLREIFLKNALQAYIDGEDVQALIRTGDDEYRMVPIETLFEDSRFLIDKKAAKANPEFDAAVQEMVSQDPPPQRSLREILQSLPEAPRNRPADVLLAVPNGNR